MLNYGTNISLEDAVCSVVLCIYLLSEVMHELILEFNLGPQRAACYLNLGTLKSKYAQYFLFNVKNMIIKKPAENYLSVCFYIKF